LLLFGSFWLEEDVNLAMPPMAEIASVIMTRLNRPGALLKRNPYEASFLQYSQALGLLPFVLGETGVWVLRAKTVRLEILNTCWRRGLGFRAVLSYDTFCIQ